MFSHGLSHNLKLQPLDARFSQQSDDSKLEGREALRIYHKIREDGDNASVSLVIDALRECGRLKDLKTGRRLHRECGGSINIFVANTLVDMYAKCGSVVEACQVFDKMEERNTVSWNTVIMRVAQSGDGELALSLFSRMQDEGFKPDSRTFVAALKACSRLASGDVAQEKVQCLERGRVIHRQAAKRGHDQDIFVANTLVDMYAKCGSMEESQQVFNRMKNRTVVSWNAVIMGFSQNGEPELAVEYFRRMQEAGFVADALTFVAVLTACSGLSDKEEGLSVEGKLVKPVSLKMAVALHTEAAKGGHHTNMFVANTLVDLYARCGRLMEARRVFDQMQRHDVTSWNVVILRHGESGEEKLALQLFTRMLEEGNVPDARTYVAALKACSGLASREDGAAQERMTALEKGMAIHALAFQNGYNSDIFVANTLMDMYSNCGSVQDASQVFEGMKRRNVVSWNVVLTAYAQGGQCELALQTLTRMIDEGFEPDSRTCVAAINACTGLEATEQGRLVDGKLVKLKCLEKGMAIHARVAEKGYDRKENFVGNALVDMYAKFGSMEDAAGVFTRMQHRTVISWNSIITGYAQTGEPELALLAFSRMLEAGDHYRPSSLSYVAALKACGTWGRLRVTKELHARICSAGLESDAFVVTSLVDAYGKCGSMVDAQQLFDASADGNSKELVTWNALLVGYCQGGDTIRAFATWEELKDRGMVPDAITFLALLSACSQAGIVEKARDLFEAMAKEYGIAPGVEHYTCMLDLLGRSNHLEEAIAMANKLPVKADVTLRTMLLDACSKWKNVEAARTVFASLVEMDERDGMPYVLLGNTFVCSDT
ncbi:pentatricopeptide repeat-containing protein At3g09040, mitochondrial-like [Selaginella moellendorffii]|uniref:pentatricopeptide repeat-containing protein At3g09040, mitochondrial-like n=1 Tax=Selaginella moellendorffii TaxID=88036 RepID=UPI000D1C645E|nr:pentatricopeptide repeat-containing protein At3g09040, mitochondrial-like [Selaginella moellendorffii]|eukprot:XP_024516600.1 pentatricopeptide repeat-containing protein At3g09040, mitochondrial-like [Selaginella moellendorffii]